MTIPDSTDVPGPSGGPQHAVSIFAGYELLIAFLAALALAAGATALDGWPAPRAFDEFSQILAGDTFARGRLTNPSHALPQFFETIHVLQQPSYSAKYFPGHGMFLALGITLGGGARLGQWIAFATMAPALLWMLSGWTSRRTTVVGSTIMLLLLADTPWTSGYWGSALTVTGSALLFGALPRLTRGGSPHPRTAALMGLGIVMMALTRPFEGLAACVPLALFYGVWTVFPRRHAAQRLARVALPTVLVLAAGGTLLALHNRAVTGNALQSGYALYEATAPGAPPFFWQAPVGVDRTLRANEEARRMIDMNAYTALREWWRGEMRVRFFSATVPYYLPHVAFLLMLLLAPFGMTDWRLWLAAASALSVATAVGVSSFYLAHYMAPALPPILLFYVVAFQVADTWTFRAHRIGRHAALLVVALLGVLATARVFTMVPEEHELTVDNHWTRRREALERHLRTGPGSHLVFVNYDSIYVSQTEWVQNSADLGGTRVLWAHDLGSDENARLLALTPERTAWRLVVSGIRNQPPLLSPYRGSQAGQRIPVDRSIGDISNPPYR